MRREEINNPRYPHHIRIIRKVYKDWLDDESSEGGELVSGDNEIVIYEGPGRSYTETTTTGDKVVDINKRKASIPVRFDEWRSSTSSSESAGNGQLIPMSGDMVYVTKGFITEEWEVKDFEPDNYRSVVYGQMNRSIDNG